MSNSVFETIISAPETSLSTKMSKQRLNHLLILHVSKNISDKPDKLSVFNFEHEFVGQAEHRLTLFVCLSVFTQKKHEF